MKKSDVQVLSCLRASGRMPLTVLSRKTGLPVSTLHEKLRQKVGQGLCKPALLLDFGKLGFQATAFIKLAVDTGEKDKLLSYLAVCPQVNSLFRINNGWHALAECVFSDMRALEAFVEKLDDKFHVRQKDICYVLEELRREVFLADLSSAEHLLAQSKL